MLKRLIPNAFAIALLQAASAYAGCPTGGPTTLTNGSTADATQVMNNFSCYALLAGANFTGNVGIGVSPSTLLDVAGTGDARITVRSTDATAGNYTGFQLKDGSGVFRGGVFIQNNNKDIVQLWNSAQDIMNLTNGRVGIGTLTPGNLLEIANNGAYSPGIRINNNTAWWQLGAGVFLPNDGLFSIYGSSAGTSLVINSYGYVGIGEINPAYPLQVNGSAAGNAAWINLSDGRLKTNVANFTGGLAAIRRLRPVRFNWTASANRPVGKDLNLSTTEAHVGFIAQEVQAVVPEAVAAPTNPKGLYGLKESDLIPVLVSAVQELQAEVDALKAQAASKPSS